MIMGRLVCEKEQKEQCKFLADKRLEQASAALLAGHKDAPLLVAFAAGRQAKIVDHIERVKEQCARQADELIQHCALQQQARVRMQAWRSCLARWTRGCGRETSSQDAGRRLESCPCLLGRLRDLAGPGPRHAASKGDFNFKVPTSSDPAAKTGKRRGDRELPPGHDGDHRHVHPGAAWGDRALRTASPLRAVENVPGAQAPACVWDPAGLAASGNTECLSATAARQAAASVR
jgi:hypothetical protein